jgi:hypothetical protein
MSLAKWIAICPDGIVTDEVISMAIALQVAQKAEKEPIPVTVEPGPVDPAVPGPEGDGVPIEP